MSWCTTVSTFSSSRPSLVGLCAIILGCVVISDAYLRISLHSHGLRQVCFSKTALKGPRFDLVFYRSKLVSFDG